MRKYLVFAGAINSARGGAEDLVGTTDSEEGLKFLTKKLLADNKYDWIDIYDTETNKTIRKWTNAINNKEL